MQNKKYQCVDGNGDRYKRYEGQKRREERRPREREAELEDRKPYRHRNDADEKLEPRGRIELCRYYHAFI